MEQKNRLIGDETYYVTQMDAFSATKIETKLIKLCGVGIFSSLSTLKAPKENTEEKIKGVILDAIPLIMENFDDEIANDLILSLFENGVFTKVDGHLEKVDFETHFIGKTMEKWKVIFFILEVNLNLGKSIGFSSPITEKDKPAKEN